MYSVVVITTSEKITHIDILLGFFLLWLLLSSSLSRGSTTSATSGSGTTRATHGGEVLGALLNKFGDGFSF